MPDLYTSIIFLCWLTLGTLCILVRENDRIPRGDKRLLYLTYALVAVSALAEWCGVQLDGRAEMPTWTLRLAKCADYILTPMAGGALMAQMRFRNVWHKVMLAVLGANALVQIVSAPFGWMAAIDGHNHYTHGPLFPAYIGLCLVIIAIIIIQFVIYGQSFRKRNRQSLYTIMIVVVAAIALQEVLGNRTAYIGMTVGAALMFIHYSEFSQLAADDTMAEQRIQIMMTQIQPHFLYNALGSIEALCDRDPQAAKLATRKFSKYLRGNMDSITGENRIPFDKELQHTQLYLELEQIRFGDALQVAYDIEVHDFFLPPLTLEPIVENAVKHGVRGNADGRGAVTIATREFDDRYELRVTDNGPGFDPDAVPEDEPHIGIRNVRERLERICGGKLQIDSAPGRGAAVTILLPKKGGN